MKGKDKDAPIKVLNENSTDDLELQHRHSLIEWAVIRMCPSVLDDRFSFTQAFWQYAVNDLRRHRPGPVKTYSDYVRAASTLTPLLRQRE